MQCAKEIIKNGYFDKVSKSTGRILHMTSAYVEDMKNIDLTSQIEKLKSDLLEVKGLVDIQEKGIIELFERLKEIEKLGFKKCQKI